MRPRTFLPALPVVMLTTLLAGCGSEQASSSDETIGADVVEIDSLFAEWDRPGSPGCGLAIAEKGVLSYARGYGYANLDHAVPIGPTTVFDVASVTKQFTAASILMLHQDGQLSIDDDIRRWLPELPDLGPIITIRHLLQHTSGLRDYLTLFPLAGRGDHYPISHPQLLEMMSRQRALVSLPGDRYAYSNTGFMLLSQIVERVSGQTLGQFTAERIFQPLNMTQSFMYEDLQRVVPGRATGYDAGGEAASRIVHNYNFDIAGDGQLYTTLPDLLTWDNWLHGEVRPPIYEQMLEVGTLNNGESLSWSQGLRRSEYRGLETIGHSGSSWGFRTELIRYVDADLSIAISCNMDDVGPRRLAEQVADIYLADRLQPLEVAEDSEGSDTDDSNQADAGAAATATQQAEYAGEYYSRELDATYRLIAAEDGLKLKIEQEPLENTVVLANDLVQAEFHSYGWSGTTILDLEMQRDNFGEVNGFLLSLGRTQNLIFEKR